MIFLASLLTVLIEGAFFAILGYRDRVSITVIVCANVVTNLLLNLLLWLAFPCGAGAWIYLMEAVVVQQKAGTAGKGPRLYGQRFAGSSRSGDPGRDDGAVYL